MSDLFTVDHVAQLQEIQKARLRRNQPGIGPMVEELIRRLTDGGVAGNTKGIRVAQAKRYWDLGVGREFCFASFSDYLGLIPEVPEPLNCVDAAFPILLLVEPRLGLKELCDLAGVGFDGNNRTFVAYDRHHYEFSVPTWIRVQDGWHYRNRAVRDCRKSFGQGEVGLTALQGVCLYVQHPELWVEPERLRKSRPGSSWLRPSRPPRQRGVSQHAGRPAEAQRELRRRRQLGVRFCVASGVLGTLTSNTRSFSKT